MTQLALPYLQQPRVAVRGAERGTAPEEEEDPDSADSAWPAASLLVLMSSPAPFPPAVRASPSAASPTVSAAVSAALRAFFDALRWELYASASTTAAAAAAAAGSTPSKPSQGPGSVDRRWRSVNISLLSSPTRPLTTTNARDLAEPQATAEAVQLLSAAARGARSFAAGAGAGAGTRAVSWFWRKLYAAAPGVVEWLWWRRVAAAAGASAAASALPTGRAPAPQPSDSLVPRSASAGAASPSASNSTINPASTPNRDTDSASSAAHSTSTASNAFASADPSRLMHPTLHVPISRASDVE